MRAYIGTRVGKHMYVGTSLRPQEAMGVGVIWLIVTVIGPLAAGVCLFNAMYLLSIMIAFAHHEWAKVIGGLVMQVGWWGLVVAVIWAIRRQKRKPKTYVPGGNGRFDLLRDLPPLEKEKTIPRWTMCPQHPGLMVYQCKDKHHDSGEESIK